MTAALALPGGFLAAWLLGAGWVPAAQEPVAPAEGPGTASLSEKDAERLFLGFIHNRENLIRSCHFLGGVLIEEILPAERTVTVRIRYRIECTQEEITLPPLTRTLRENFVYRDRGGSWEILGRASELPPGWPDAAPNAPLARAPDTPDPRARDRRDVAEKILSWAVNGRMPDGVKKPFPGAELIPGKSPVLVSSEGLEGVTDLTVAGRKVILLSPEALLERTALKSGGVWFCFEILELNGDSARARVSLVTRLLSVPRAGTPPTRVLSRVEADFQRDGPSWILLRYQPLN